MALQTIFNENASGQKPAIVSLHKSYLQILHALLNYS